MPLVISMQFKAGRFHATPWGRHVNEGVPEWPPSPWRILRTIVAVAKRKTSVDNQILKSLLEKLLAPPDFVLPPATSGHLRCYLPWFKKGPDDKTLVFDTFVALDKQSDVSMCWPSVSLTETEKNSLTQILYNLGFMGRAESWCEARILSDQDAQEASGKVNCKPLNGTPVQSNQELVRVLCADPEKAFANDRTPKYQETIGKGKTKVTTDHPLYDPDWNLCMETLVIHKEKWSDPPGAKWVQYVRPTDCFKVTYRPRIKRTVKPRFQVARYALDSPVLPLVEETLPLAELARRTLMGIYKSIIWKRDYPGVEKDQLPRIASRIFSGKGENGVPLKGHGHAYYLPTDEDHDGHIDHLTVFAQEGFGEDEEMALDRLHSLNRGEELPRLNLLLINLAKHEDISNSLFAESTVWESATPYIVSRHYKSRGTKRDEPELRFEDEERSFARKVLFEDILQHQKYNPNLPTPTEISVIHSEDPNRKGRIGAHLLRPIQFKRFRRKSGDDGGRRQSGGFSIVFEKPVKGPLVFGHSSHFGMGLFLPVKREE